MGLLVVIPARSGSVRLPGKNMLRLGGRTLVEWAIGSAAHVPDRLATVVSTDSEEIAAVARAAGVYAHMRTAEQANGQQPPALVGQLCLDWWAREGGNELGRPVPEGEEHLTVTGVVLLQPTSPLRRSDEVRAACNRFNATEQLRSLWSTSAGYDGAPDGQLWITRPDALRASERWECPRGLPYSMSPCIDLNTREDWRLLLQDHYAASRVAP